MTQDTEVAEDERTKLANLIPLGFTPRDPVSNVFEAADRILAAGFRYVGDDWEYGVSIDGGDPTPVWDEYPGDDGRANLEKGGAARMLRRRKAGPWEQIDD